MNRTIVLLFLFSLATIVQGENSQSMPKEIELKHIPMELVEEGEFVMGSDKVDKSGLQNEFGSIKPWYMDEHPKHNEKLSAFYIGKYEITNFQFRNYVMETHANPPIGWLETGYIVTLKMNKLKNLSEKHLRKVIVDKFHIDVDTRKLNKRKLLEVVEKHFRKIDALPVRYVNWYEAESFCEWEGAKLPTEAQWEKAARGPNGNEFPWGNSFKPGMSNTGEEEWPLGTAPGGSYKSDKSYFGIFDLAGNVSEWVFDWYHAYPGSDFKSKEFGKKFKVIRGAGWGGSGHYALEMYQRGAYRLYLPPNAQHEDLGFRCAVDAKAALKRISMKH